MSFHSISLSHAVENLLEDFVENYHLNYEVTGPHWMSNIRDMWEEFLEDEANRCFESLKVKYLLEFGFDEAFGVVVEKRGSLIGFPKENIMSYLYSTVLHHLAYEKYGDIEDIVATRVGELTCECGEIKSKEDMYCDECEEKQNKCEEDA